MTFQVKNSAQRPRSWNVRSRCRSDLEEGDLALLVAAGAAGTTAGALSELRLALASAICRSDSMPDRHSPLPGSREFPLSGVG